MESWSKVMEPGNTPPVDIFPFLHWVPERLFGNWRSRASFVRDEMNALYSAQVERVRARRASGELKESFMDAVLEQNEKLTLSPHELAFLGGVMMEGGSDTSSATIISFLQAMTRWPEYQSTAQAQIDVVVPEDRSPQWAQDYDALPYVAQIVKESMRWRPVVPLAFPHAAAQDDEVDGFRIPKGSAVILNGWGMQHDAARFARPEVFDPAHYAGFTRPASALALEADPAKRDHYGYGSGRRLCPGIHLGERNLWVGIAKLLWAFEICAVEGEMPDTDAVTGYCEGFLVCAKDFKCRIRVRSEERRKTIVREFEEAKKVFARFE
jgi:cytochrome P450